HQYPMKKRARKRDLYARQCLVVVCSDAVGSKSLGQAGQSGRIYAGHTLACLCRQLIRISIEQSLLSFIIAAGLRVLRGIQLRAQSVGYSTVTVRPARTVVYVCPRQIAKT